MANEIQAVLKLSCNNSGYSDTFNQIFNVNQSTPGASGGLFTVGTSASAVPVGSISTLGYACFQNCDATNYVQIGAWVYPGVFVSLVKLLPGQSAIMPLDAVTVYWKANSSPCNVQLLLLSA